MTSEILWYASRGTGVASALLFTAVVVLGATTAGRMNRSAAQATVVMAVHRWLAMASVAFIGVHVITAVVDGYVAVHWWDVLIPFGSDYEPFWLGLGTVAFDLFLAVLLTSLVRQRIPEHVWRLVHWAAYASWPVAMIHGVAMGTADEPLLLGMTLACVVAGATAVSWRLLHNSADDQRRLAVARQEWV